VQRATECSHLTAYGYLLKAHRFMIGESSRGHQRAFFKSKDEEMFL